MRIAGSEPTTPRTPNRVKATLLRDRYARDRLLLETPCPKDFPEGFGDSGDKTRDQFWMTTHSAYNEICNSFEPMSGTSSGAGKDHIPFPIRLLRSEKIGYVNGDAQARDRAILGPSRFFLSGRCSDDEWSKAADAQTIWRGEGSGDRRRKRGRFHVHLCRAQRSSLSKHGRAIRVGVLRAGRLLGEMSLLTGEPRTGIVRARKTGGCSKSSSNR